MNRMLVLAPLVAMITAISVTLGACSDTPETAPSTAANQMVGQVVPVEGGGQYIDIIAQDLKTMLENKDFFFVNVHIPYEGELEQTDAFIPFDEVPARLAEFPEALDAKIVLYCRSGSMSAAAARDLVEAGYTNVYNLDGGFRAWEAAGYELLQNQ